VCGECRCCETEPVQMPVLRDRAGALEPLQYSLGVKPESVWTMLKTHAATWLREEI